MTAKEVKNVYEIEIRAAKSLQSTSISYTIAHRYNIAKEQVQYTQIINPP